MLNALFLHVFKPNNMLFSHVFKKSCGKNRKVFVLRNVESDIFFVSKTNKTLPLPNKHKPYINKV